MQRFVVVGGKHNGGADLTAIWGDRIFTEKDIARIKADEQDGKSGTGISACGV